MKTRHRHRRLGRMAGGWPAVVSAVAVAIILAASLALTACTDSTPQPASPLGAAAGRALIAGESHG